MKMNLYSMLLASTLCFLPIANAENMPASDARSTWNCVYPYTESNCQTVLLAWAKDHEVPPETVFDGKQCSNCESAYYTDDLGNKHLIYATCKNRFGAAFSVSNFLAPIKRYENSKSDSVGWTVVDWQFEKCFETWQCGYYCSLNTNPPTCMKHRTTNWGLYVPVLDGICSYGTDSSDDYTPQPGSPEPSSQPLIRDSSWTPVY